MLLSPTIALRYDNIKCNIIMFTRRRGVEFSSQGCRRRRFFYKKNTKLRKIVRSRHNRRPTDQPTDRPTRFIHGRWLTRRNISYYYYDRWSHPNGFRYLRWRLL